MSGSTKINSAVTPAPRSRMVRLANRLFFLASVCTATRMKPISAATTAMPRRTTPSTRRSTPSLNPSSNRNVAARTATILKLLFITFSPLPHGGLSLDDVAQLLLPLCGGSSMPGGDNVVHAACCFLGEKAYSYRQMLHIGSIRQAIYSLRYATYIQIMYCNDLIC